MRRALILLPLLALCGCGPETQGQGKGYITSSSVVNAWIDTETGRRYLVFERINGIAVIEAPLSLEKK